jgi:hypothetical protein
MKKIITVIILVLSFNIFAGSITNKTTDEKITVTCLDEVKSICTRYEIFKELDSDTSVNYLEKSSKYFSDKDTYLLAGSTVGTIAPAIMFSWWESKILSVPATIVVTPVTILGGIIYDVALAPVKLVRLVVEKKTNKLLKSLFRLDKEVSKKTNDKTFKRILEVLN